MPPLPYQGEATEEEVVIVNGPPLTEDQIRAYETWKIQSKGKAPIVTSAVTEEKKVIIEEYA